MRTREELAPNGCMHQDKKPCYECLMSDYLDLEVEVAMRTPTWMEADRDSWKRLAELTNVRAQRAQEEIHDLQGRVGPLSQAFNEQEAELDEAREILQDIVNLVSDRETVALRPTNECIKHAMDWLKKQENS